MTDKWKHRSKRMKCSTCMWSIIKESSKVTNTEETLNAPNSGIGRCRRHAPTMNGYPVIFFDDWCGDHKLDENK